MRQGALTSSRNSRRCVAGVGEIEKLGARNEFEGRDDRICAALVWLAARWMLVGWSGSCSKDKAGRGRQQCKAVWWLAQVVVPLYRRYVITSHHCTGTSQGARETRGLGASLDLDVTCESYGARSNCFLTSFALPDYLQLQSVVLTRASFKPLESLDFCATALNS